MRFELKAVASDGRVERLDFEASDRSSATRLVQGRGYTVLSVRTKVLAGLWRRAARFPVALFSQELRALLAAGLPLVEAIDTLAQREKRDEFRAVLQRVAALLSEGRNFSAALEQYPQFFSTLYVATVRAAERTSD